MAFVCVYIIIPNLETAFQVPSCRCRRASSPLTCVLYLTLVYKFCLVKKKIKQFVPYDMSTFSPNFTVSCFYDFIVGAIFSKSFTRLDSHRVLTKVKVIKV